MSGHGKRRASRARKRSLSEEGSGPDTTPLPCAPAPTPTSDAKNHAGSSELDGGASEHGEGSAACSLCGSSKNARYRFKDDVLGDGGDLDQYNALLAKEEDAKVLDPSSKVNTGSNDVIYLITIP